MVARGLETGVMALDVKKLVAGLLLWNARVEGMGLKADLEMVVMVEVSLKGFRSVNAIMDNGLFCGSQVYCVVLVSLNLVVHSF